MPFQTSHMDLGTKTRRPNEREEDTGRPASFKSGIWWGIFLLAAGMCLFLALFSFNIKEIGWSALNSSGIVLDGCRNYLGPVGLYAAGLFYWLVGASAWLVVLLLYWFGFYRIFKKGHLPARMVYWGIGGIIASCVFFAAQSWLGGQWTASHELASMGGFIGYVLGPLTLQRLINQSGLVLLSGLVYMTALIYVSGTRPMALFRGMGREWRLWRQRKKEPVREPYPAERKMPKFEDKFGKAKKPAQEALKEIFEKEKTDAPLPKFKRTGDDLSALEEGKQGELGLAFKPKIVDASRSKPITEAESIPPSSSPFSERALGGYEHYVLPDINLLHHEEAPPEQSAPEKEALSATRAIIINTIKSFGVAVPPGDITKGPTITRYEIYPTPGLRVSKITNLEQDIARATRAIRINILAPIPGRDTVGIEIANKKKVPVVLRDLLLDPEFKAPNKRIPLALGKDVYGRTVIGDLAAMPHLLVAGTTGSGKSVCINSIITSMLYRFRPDELKFILVDPKVVEMQPYGKLPHLIVPVVTDPNKVVGALRWCVNEMERRYRYFAEVGVRNFEAYNNRPKEDKNDQSVAVEEPDQEEVDYDLIESIADDFESQGENPRSVWEDEPEIEDDPDDEILPDKFPYIVVIIDELADLMQTVKDDIETYISRLTQKARAAGIHLIVATQTPRSEVLTGTIKANIPTRIAFQVSSALDSRIILDQGGAEKLVGKGDLLYLPPGSGKTDRAQGAFISDDEVELLVEHCASQAKQEFHESVQETIESGGSTGQSEGAVSPGDEELYSTCLEVVVIERKASTSLLQRRLSIGYGKAARMMDLLEKRGVISPSDGTNRPRDVLV